MAPKRRNATASAAGFVPIVEIKNATVVVSDGKNRSATIEHLQFDGHPRARSSGNASRRFRGTSI